MEVYTFNAYGVTWSEEHGTYTCYTSRHQRTSVEIRRV